MYDFLTPDYKNLVQILITAPVLYALVIISIRLMGNRSTSSMNNFDWIVTVAIGSIFASTVVLNGTNLLEGVFAISFLLVIQFAVTYAVRRWEGVRNTVKSTPQLLFYDGEFMKETMTGQRIIRAEVFAAMRERGYQNIDQVYAVVLETNAAISIIARDDNDERKPFSLSDVQGLPEGLQETLREEGAKTEKNSKEDSGGKGDPDETDNAGWSDGGRRETKGATVKVAP